jgi:hypothetical protein
MDNVKSEFKSFDELMFEAKVLSLEGQNLEYVDSRSDEILLIQMLQDYEQQQWEEGEDH